jgi:hypothetical protein
MWLLKTLEKHSQKQKVHGLGIRLTNNNTAKGLWEKYAYEITILVCVCVCVCARTRMRTCEQ